MKIISNQLKPLCIEATMKAFPELSEGELLELVTLEEPRDPSHGDAACSVAFKLAGRLGKKPREIGEAIVAAFPENFMIGSVEFADPGFVNLRLSVAFLEENLKGLEGGFSVEGEERRKAPVIVEYNSANAAKIMGAHHIITTVLGDALANLFDFLGYEVIRINHLGDWGTHFGKLIYAIENWGDKSVIHANPNEELTKLYVRFNEEAEKDPALDDEARRIFRELEEGEPKYKEIWDWVVSESIVDLEKIFKRLGVTFDHITGESFYSDMTEKILEEGMAKGVFVKGEGGALIFDMGEDQTPAMLRKSDGATLYLTRDVATVKYRVETWHPEAILYVVDHAQSLHFKQNFAIAKAMHYVEEGPDGTALEHISFGRMSFKDQAMSTRKGNVIKLDALLDEAAGKALELAKDRGAEVGKGGSDSGDLAALAELIGIASVKYGVLSQDRNRDIIFDWNKVITLEGNSAPYLLYSYARASRIVKKVSEVGEVALGGMPELSEEAEIALVRQMVKFPEVLEAALSERKPHTVSTFLYELCQGFNRFYGEVSVMNAKTEISKRTRLGIVHAFMHQLKAGLGILGIPVVERM